MIRPTVHLRYPDARGHSSHFTSSGVSERPRAGSRYPPHASYNSEEAARWWTNTNLPGGRQLWCRLVIVFTFISVFGFIFIFISASFVSQAYMMYKEQKLSLPLVWCIIGIVSGTLMVLGSIILGRLIISNKWRKNEQPTYQRRAPSQPQVHYIANSNDSDSDSNSEVQIDLPPPYQGSELPPIFVVTGRNVALRLPPETSEIFMLPTYSDAIKNKPPKYTQLDPLAAGSGTQNSQQGAAGATASQSDHQMEAPNTGPNRIEVITVVASPQVQASVSPPPPYEESELVSTRICHSQPGQACAGEGQVGTYSEYS